MKIHVLGTCSGTEPYPNRHHVSFALDYDGGLYWFDAGECCSYTAHIMGIDLLRTRKICISHTHMDHIGGLGNLLWTIRKLDTMRHVMEGRSIKLYIPNLIVWESIRTTLAHTEGGFVCDFDITAVEYSDGVVFEENGLRVSALHNHHLEHEEGTPWRSFGFAAETPSKKIVYSGDTKSVDDFEPLLKNCDLLLMETGHHNPVKVAEELIRRDIMPSKLAFIHHGRDILHDYDKYMNILTELLGDKVCILDDATTMEI